MTPRPSGSAGSAGISGPGTDRKVTRVSNLLQIGQVAERTGLSLKTIRHYDETGLVVPSERSRGGFRLYTPADVDRLLVVRRMKPLGFTLEQMRELLAALADLDDPHASADRHATARAFIAEYSAVADRRCAELRTQLGYAEEFSRLLADVGGSGAMR